MAIDHRAPSRRGGWISAVVAAGCAAGLALDAFASTPDDMAPWLFRPAPKGDLTPDGPVGSDLADAPAPWLMRMPTLAEYYLVTDFVAEVRVAVEDVFAPENLITIGYYSERYQRLRLEARLAVLELAMNEVAAPVAPDADPIMPVVSADADVDQRADFSALHRQYQLLSERWDVLVQERDSLEAQVAALTGALEASDRAHDELTYRLSLWTIDDINAAQDVIAMTGLDVELMLLRLAASQPAVSRGGPYLAASAAPVVSAQDESTAALGSHIERWDGLRQLLRMLPLGQPMDEYKLTSGYGHRIDPINGRDAYHSGLDFVGPMRTPIRTTAPGVVAFADWRTGYGRLVIIDHGLGITTRYAHLSGILVEAGDVVDYRQPIGLLGSSGRSTGPHLHYEVRLDGVAGDPMMFLDAGRYVFKAQAEAE